MRVRDFGCTLYGKERRIRFGIIGVGGYIAARHLKAMYEVGGELVCALDVNDSVGVLEMYFPEAEFFTRESAFVAFASNLLARAEGLDFISVCTPNFLHKRHIMLALKLASNVICEKPIVLDMRAFASLYKLEYGIPYRTESKAFQNLMSDSDKIESKKPRIFGILQLRLHQEIINLKRRIQDDLIDNPAKYYKLKLHYITARGKWYFASWKGDERKSGGIICNIGVHLFDMLIFVFGRAQSNVLLESSAHRASGVLYFANAEIVWLLSVDSKDLPTGSHKALRTLESSDGSGEIYFDFSQGFEDLHTKSYEEIIQNRGFGLDEVYECIKLMTYIRGQESKRSC